MRILVLAVAMLVAETSASAANVEKPVLRSAATKSVALMQNVGRFWFKRQTCTSCHHQLLPMMALEAAREHGVPVNEEDAQKTLAKSFAYMSDFDAAVQYLEQIDPAMADANMLVAQHASGIPASLTTAIYARQIAARQRVGGEWLSFDGRPPQSQSQVTATALALRALELYMPAQLEAEKRARVDVARKWLLARVPENSEERAFRLQGLSWAGAADADLQAAAAEILSKQRPDGGWSQIPGRPSDAYATGEALVTLNRAASLAVDHPAYQHGLRFLLSTQKPDGSWQVVTRIAPPAQVSPPYFESGFPYGHSQFISCAATAWASTALMLALDKVQPAAAGVGEMAVFQPKSLPLPQAALQTVLFGTPAELRSLLDKGLDPNTKTAGGTTLLMMAAGNLDKVKGLVEHGAEINARAKTGFNAFMVASNYVGSAPVLRYLMEHGADVKAGADTKVRYDASALFMASACGDTESVGLILDRGVDVNGVMLLIGSVPVTSLAYAIGEGDVPMVRYLIRRGADVNAKDPNGDTPLILSVFAGYPAVIQELIDAGAKVNVKDKFGMTALLYASSYNHGRADTVEVLLKAGADRAARDKSGRTPLLLAQKYGIPNAPEILK